MTSRGMFVRSFKWLVVLVVIVMVVIAVPVVQFLRPTPTFTLASKGAVETTVPGAAPKIDWPKEGQAALIAVGVGKMGQSGAQTPSPIASVTKVMTAYLILKQHPLGVGESGPEITVTKADYQTYLTDKAKGESVLPVKAGEKLTERQALEGLLLPSGNNVATLLANWAAGSNTKFVQQMNDMAKKMGMTQTHYADASGFLPASASTAVDQVKIFAKTMGINAFKEIVGEAQATLPVAGTVYNVDYVLGHGGIIGGKTGSTGHAGGCFVFASQKTVGSKNVLIVGAVLGQTAATSSLMAALDEGVKLSEEAQAALHEVQVVTPSQPVATLNAPWMTSQLLRPANTVKVIGWNGMNIASDVAITPNMKGNLTAGQTVGTLTVTAGDQKEQVSLKTDSAVAGPSYLWRLKRL